LEGRLGRRRAIPAIVSNSAEYPAEEWWEALDAALADGTAPEELQDLASDERADVSADRLDEVLEFAASLPGWDGGPEHAPNPFAVVDSDDDDDDEDSE
jgi:hypothetical protein